MKRFFNESTTTDLSRRQLNLEGDKTSPFCLHVLQQLTHCFKKRIKFRCEQLHNSENKIMFFPKTTTIIRLNLIRIADKVT